MAKLKETSVAAIFQNNVAKFGDKPCVAYKKGDAYTDLSWKQMNEKIQNTAYYLLDQGIKKGDKVALFAPNRYEWYVADMAILSIGAVNVPIYATNSPDEALYILEDSDSKICFCGTEDHLDRILKVRKKLPKLAQLIIFDDYPKKKQGVITLEKAMEQGSRYKSKGNFDKRLKAIKSEDLATLIYTSGTTGNPKGVMLTHNN
ncbi:MAG: AMP-binding protein, partial [Bacteroidota bacterium]